MVTTASAPSSTPAADPNTPIPAALAACKAAGTTSKPVTSCPALARLRAIGRPMLPRPTNPMRAMAPSPSSQFLLAFSPYRIRGGAGNARTGGNGGSGKAEIARAERAEVVLDHRRRHLGERRRRPLRLVVLVDQQGSDALIEVLAGHEGLAQAVLLDHGLVEVERRALLD